MPQINIVLYCPEIAGNVGSIMRTCVALGATLHLIEPLGFYWDQRILERTSLHLMQQLRYYIFVDFTTFLKQHAYPPLIGVATDGKYLYHQYNFVKEQDLYLLFGSESRGLPGEIISLCQQQTVRIPMKNNIDSLNLALSVGIIGYEVWRQWNFK